ncbi:MAG: stage III sporulation protein SpoIIIAB [bacterium]
MVKIIGAALIIIACGLFGNSVASAYARRPNLLRSFQTALQFLETEIDYGATPLPEALEKVAWSAGPELELFFFKVREHLLSATGYSIQEAWGIGLDDLSANSVLRTQELEVLAPLGGILGSSNREDQVKHLQLTLQQLKVAEEKTRDEANRNEKMWRYLGFLLGAMLVLTFY